MGKVLIHQATANKRAIEFYLMLQEIEQMPLIYVAIEDGALFIADRANRRMYRECGVDFVLRLNPKKAIENGGTYKALMDSYGPAKAVVPQVVVDEEVHSLLSGED